jgi:tetratricopeptide (TPR) repeat protein
VGKTKKQHFPRASSADAAKHDTAKPPRDARFLPAIYAVLFLATLLVYAPVLQFDFVNFDDPDYVTRNVHVQSGISGEGIAWAFTSGEAANWFPVTRLSHMLDYQLYGLRSGGHHFTNVLFHALAALLLFAFLHRATGARWPSAFVAFLFALHPQHVESVAWISERKDVLCAFFWFLTLWAYVHYAERPGLGGKALGWYLFALLAFCLGLMSKPMIVTLPFVLILLDGWPLRRLTENRLMPVFLEKIPFFALCAVDAVATYVVQEGSGAVRTLDVFPMGLRVENGLRSYVLYIVKMFWPVRLAVFYPFPHHLPLWLVALAGVGLVSISAGVLWSIKARPDLAVGWFWYIGTLVPVIGFVMVGAQARADRYAYVPMTGLTIMLAWGATDILRRWPRALAALAVMLCCFSMAATAAQVRYWKNSESLFRHALDVTSDNYLAHHNLGVALAQMPGRLPEAIDHYQAALQIKPDSPQAHTDYGNALAQIPGRLPEAVAEYRTALLIFPDSPIPHNDLGNALSAMGRLPEAIAEYQTALRLKPDYSDAQNNLRLAQANTAEWQYNMGVDLAKSGKAAEAIPHFEAALRLKPDFVDAHNNLGVTLAGSGRVAEAISHFETALKIDPHSADAHVNLGIALAGVPGRMPEAIAHFQAALRIRPDPEIRQLLNHYKKP